MSAEGLSKARLGRGHAHDVMTGYVERGVADHA
jgi:hypothetical protein